MLKAIRPWGWLAWLIIMTGFIWLGFEHHWNFDSWLQIGLMVAAWFLGWILYLAERRKAKMLALLSPAERESHFSKMWSKQRERIRWWVENDQT